MLINVVITAVYIRDLKIYVWGVFNAFNHFSHLKDIGFLYNISHLIIYEKYFSFITTILINNDKLKKEFFKNC